MKMKGNTIISSYNERISETANKAQAPEIISTM